MAQSARQLEFVIRRHGGRRVGAGRKAVPGARRNVAHRSRSAHDRHAPVHVTLRAGVLGASLRLPSVFLVVRSAIARASGKVFRIVVFSVSATMST